MGWFGARRMPGLACSSWKCLQSLRTTPNLQEEEPLFHSSFYSYSSWKRHVLTGSFTSKWSHASSSLKAGLCLTPVFPPDVGSEQTPTEKAVRCAGLTPVYWSQNQIRAPGWPVAVRSWRGPDSSFFWAFPLYLIPRGNERDPKAVVLIIAMHQTPVDSLFLKHT